MSAPIIAENSIISIQKEASYGVYIETSQTEIPVQTGLPKTDPMLVGRDDDKVGSVSVVEEYDQHS